MTTTREALQSFGKEYLQLRALLEEVGDSQWRAGQTPVPREDTSERSRGMVSDPTPSIVADTRRLELRAQVIIAEQALTTAASELSAARRHLEAALTKWQG